MALSLSNLVRRRSDKPPRMVIYGVPGIGKTSLAAEFPDPIFIQTEEGAGNLELTTFSNGPLTSAAEVDEAIELLLTGDHGYALFDDFRKACPRQYINAGVSHQLR